MEQNQQSLPFGFSFYATRPEQFTKTLAQNFNYCEAVLFAKEDLNKKNWENAWENIKKVVNIKDPEKVSFHFPMNGCDFVEDQFVKDRLFEAFHRVKNMGMKTLVVHSNRIDELKNWKNKNYERMKTEVIQTLIELLDKSNTKISVCLENMPPIGNWGTDGDPLLLYPSDFSEVLNSPINITWDICHYFQVVGTMQLVKEGKMRKDHLPFYKDCDFFDFLSIIPKIKHWHFSSFNGFAFPYSKQHCQEGVHPKFGSIEEKFYQKSLLTIVDDSKGQKAIIFEIGETNYVTRDNILNVLQWANKIVNNQQQKNSV